MINGDLRQLPVLNAVWPSPERLTDTQLGDVVEHRFGLQNDITFGDQLFSCAEPGEHTFEVVVGKSEILAVAVFEVDAATEFGRYAVEVPRMQRMSALVLLEGAGHHAQGQLLHVRPLTMRSVPATPQV